MSTIRPFYDSKLSYEENFKKGPFGLFRNKKKFRFTGKPQYEFLGNKIFLPFGIAAGPLLRGIFTQAAMNNGFPVVVYKTVRSRLYESQSPPNLIPFKSTKVAPRKKILMSGKLTTPVSAGNSYGVPSMDPKFWQKDLKNQLEKVKNGYLVIASFQGTVSGDGNKNKYIEDWVKTAKMVKKTGAKIVEMNWSCPNEGSHDLLCFDGETTAKIAKEVRKALGPKIKIIVKLTYFQDKKLLLKNIKGVLKYIDGINTINTVPVRSVDSKGRPAFGAGREVVGAGGKSIFPLGLEMVSFLDRLRKKEKLNFVIIGTGGVVSPQEFIQYRKKGADLVMSATGAIYDPLLGQKISKL